VNMDAMLQLDRRALLQRAMLLLGAGALAGCGASPDTTSAATAAPSPSTSPSPRLTTDQLALLSAFADTLLPATDTPGAVAAGTPQTFAQMWATWASDATRAELAGALARIDAAARKAHGQGLAALDAAARHTLLAAHDAASLVAVPRPADAPPPNPFAPVYSVVDNGYAKLKELVAVLFFSSETALSHGLVYEHVPGGWTASVKVTSATRPSVAFGAF
jgi:gluconate 2-dehydrogenase gamma chain